MFEFNPLSSGMSNLVQHAATLAYQLDYYFGSSVSSLSWGLNDHNCICIIADPTLAPSKLVVQQVHDDYMR